ncbi:MAG: anti-sigma factor [Gammaproteobacteria bacterium]|nr:anti-sigma factor [Gammaproteobacteria bacterium]MCP5418740.1 anti-sigma factor [Chromatiaceae bacterium]
MKPIEDSDLHAYVDGVMEPARRIEVEAWLARHPADAARVSAWAGQNRLLHEQLDGVLNEAVPPRLLAAAAGTSSLWRQLGRMAAGLSMVGLAGLIGYGVGVRSTPKIVTVAALPRAAAIAHAVYVPEQRHPVEVTASETAHLVKWLSKRLDRKLQAPDFTAVGFELLGGRLLSGENGPVALLMYQDDGGRRVTLYVRREGDDRAVFGPSFSYAVEDGVGVFYWLDGASGYALSGNLDKKTLLGLAILAYRQLADG